MTNQVQNPNIKLICFDVNETLIQENSWLHLNLAMGITKQEDLMLLKLHEEGIISYQNWQKILLALYRKRGNPTRQIIKKIILNFTYNKGAKELIKNLQNKKYHLGIISGSMDILVETIAQELNIKLYGTTNYLVFDKTNKLKDIKVLGEDTYIKIEWLKKFCKKLQISLKECIYVGDGSNDVELFKKTGHGITFNNSNFKQYAWKTISKLSDLKKIL